MAAKFDSYVSGMGGNPGASLFEELGLYYVGPVDGHSLEDLVHIFKKIKEIPSSGPVMIHIVTEKGKGYPPAEAAADKMHGMCVCVKNREKRRDITSFNLFLQGW